MRKGSSMLVNGRLHQETWDDKQTGQKRSRLVVVCESVVFLGTGSDATKGAPEAGRKAAPREHTQPAAGAAAVAGDGPPPNDDDGENVPF
jgi:single-strand DNA-binding protein